MAAAAYLARYSGRTLDAFAHIDGRVPANPALEAKRPHIELYRTSMEQKNVAPSTIEDNDDL